MVPGVDVGSAKRNSEGVPEAHKLVVADACASLDLGASPLSSAILKVMQERSQLAMLLQQMVAVLARHGFWTAS